MQDMEVQTGGAESANGVHEDDINLAITLKVQNLLEQSGATVILTRSDENGIYSIYRMPSNQETSALPLWAENYVLHPS